MDMSMSGMDMGSSTSSSITSSLTSSLVSSITSTMSNMAMATSASSSSSSTMDMSSMSMDGMDMGSSTATASSSTSSSTGMDMDMDMSDDSSMSMNTYLVTGWKDYPVVFKTLKGKSSGGAFGVFCVVFFSAFFLRALIFLSAYLEQKVFHNYTNTIIIKDGDDCQCDPESEPEKADRTASTSSNNSRSPLRAFFLPGINEFGKDIIRLLIAFVTAMFGYAIMLATMSFVILYFFAACLGIAFGEVFFNRMSIILGINRSGALCGALH